MYPARSKWILIKQNGTTALWNVALSPFKKIDAGSPKIQIPGYRPAISEIFHLVHSGGENFSSEEVSPSFPSFRLNCFVPRVRFESWCENPGHFLNFNGNQFT